MTCIVGLVQDGEVWIGGDSASSNESGVDIRSDKKIFTLRSRTEGQEYLIGFANSYRMGQIIQYHTQIPYPAYRTPDKELDGYMVRTFCSSIEAAFKKNNYVSSEEDQGPTGDFLVGIKGHLYQISSDMSIARFDCNYTAVGSGAEYALGALHALKGYDVMPEERVKMALEAAEEHSPSVRRPFILLSQKKP